MGKEQTKFTVTTRINPLDCTYCTLRFYLYWTIFNCKSVASYATNIKYEIKSYLAHYVYKGKNVINIGQDVSEIVTRSPLACRP